MNDLLRQEVATTAHTVVVKIGTRVLTHAEGTLNEERIAQLAEQVNRIKQSGKRVILVSSGAVGAGMGRLGLKQRPIDLAKLQAVAAVGQTRLIEAYDRTFRLHGRHAAQVLLTAEDLSDRARYLNVRNTLLSLLEFDAIPVINENDTVAVEELMATFGDNDRLAALVTNLLRAPLLVILSDVDGLYDGDPRDSSSRLISTVTELNDDILRYAQREVTPFGTSVGKGGMASKLQAARMVVTAGENVIIASGRRARVLDEVFQGDPIGTLFVAQGKSISPKKRWIGFSVEPRGNLLLDEGACRAIAEEGRSLLAIGVQSVRGEFQKGDVVRLCDASGREIARGLTNYPVAELQQIRGQRSERIAEILGHCPYTEVVHRDNLAVL